MSRAIPILTTLILYAVLAGLGYRALARSDYPATTPVCPEGRVFTEWCGCAPPILGDDC